MSRTNNKATLICVQCGTAFMSSMLTAKYCSRKCRNKANAAKEATKRPPKESAVCTICGTTFLKRVPYQFTCGSPECKQQNARDNTKRTTQKLAHIRDFYIYERDNFTCAYCGKTSYEDKVKLHADHIVPRADGGQSVAGNLITSCSICNIEKSTTKMACVDSILKIVSERNAARGVPNDMPLPIAENKKHCVHI